MAYLVPALLVIVLALLHVDVRLLMLASIAASVAMSVGVQHMGEWAELLRLLIFGYHAQNPQVAALLDGGGILSMLTVMAIVCISSAYAGIFAETRMLARLQQVIEMLGHRLGACGATMITATCAAAPPATRPSPSCSLTSCAVGCTATTNPNALHKLSIWKTVPDGRWRVRGGIAGFYAAAVGLWALGFWLYRADPLACLALLPVAGHLAWQVATLDPEKTSLHFLPHYSMSA